MKYGLEIAGLRGDKTSDSKLWQIMMLIYSV